MSSEFRYNGKRMFCVERLYFREEDMLYHQLHQNPDHEQTVIKFDIEMNDHVYYFQKGSNLMNHLNQHNGELQNKYAEKTIKCKFKNKKIGKHTII